MSEEVLKYANFKKETKDLFKYKKPKYKPSKNYDDSNLYKVYREVPIKDIEIFLSDSDRTTEVAERYKNAINLQDFRKKFPEEFERLSDFTDKNKIEALEAQRKKLIKDTPFFIKYPGNYIWQVFYSMDDDKYFMLYPTKESDSTALFYLISEQIKKTTKKVYIPICLEEPKSDILTYSESTDLENYIWLFTHEWPNTIEVTKKNKTYLAITGEATFYGGFRSKYKIELHDREEAIKFYTLTKALFILETQTNYRENITPIINNKGEIGYAYNGEEITIDNLTEFTKKQMSIKKNIIDTGNKSLKEIENKKKKLQDDIDKQKEIYSNLEKQIVTFLNCRKSFFKKLRFFFKKGQKFTINVASQQNAENNEKAEDENEQIEEAKFDNTIEDLVRACIDSSKTENELSNAKADLKMVELKHINMSKKIENAKKYLDEIEEHKKSIFEFWKFANKDELTALEQGDEKANEENNDNKKILKTYDLTEEKQEFEADCDSLVRRKLSTDEQNAIFICKHTTSSINALIMEDKLEKQGKLSIEIKNILEQIIESQYEELKLNCNNDIRQEILGNIQDDFTKIKTLNDKEHRENKKNIYTSLKFNKSTGFEEYKDKLKSIIGFINEAYNKISAITDIPMYYIEDETLIENKELATRLQEINIESDKYVVASMDPTKLLKNDTIDNPTIYMVNANENTHLVYLTNIIFYDNFNKTLPLGMDEEKEVLIKIKNLKDEKSKEINIIKDLDEYSSKVLTINLIKK